MGWDGLGWLIRLGDGVKTGWVGGGGVNSGFRSGLRRLRVVCATTGICCKCNSFIQIHAPG